MKAIGLVVIALTVGACKKTEKKNEGTEGSAAGTTIGIATGSAVAAIDAAVAAEAPDGGAAAADVVASGSEGPHDPECPCRAAEA